MSTQPGADPPPPSHIKERGLWSIALAGLGLVVLFLFLGWQDWQAWRLSRIALAESSVRHGEALIEHELTRMTRQGELFAGAMPTLAEHLQRIEGHLEEQVQMEGLLRHWFVHYTSYDFFPSVDCAIRLPAVWASFCDQGMLEPRVLTDRPGAPLALLIPLRDAADERFVLWVRLGFEPLQRIAQTLSLDGQQGGILLKDALRQRADILAHAQIRGTDWVLAIYPQTEVWDGQRRYIIRRVGGAIAVVLLGVVVLLFLRLRTLAEAQRRQMLEQAHDRLYSQATHDALTGLFNRYAFNEHFHRLIRQAQRLRQPIAVLLIDIDYFKQVNDHWGHEAGDQLLRRVAAVIGERARRPLDMAARLGGEEFAVLLEGVSTEDAWVLGELLRLAVADLKLPHPRGGFVSVSVGVAGTGPEHYMPLKDLLELADHALYEAKRRGRNQVVGVWELLV
ncbi:MAG: diguanylate cyclase domain-containing protein [Halothiobacillaceae bacterium]